MTARVVHPIESMAALLPPEYMTKEVKTRLRKFAALLDNLLFLDPAGELSVDRKGLIAMATDPDLIPENLGNLVILETAKHLGRRVKEVGNGYRIGWAESAKYNELNKSGLSEIKKLGLQKGMSISELSNLLSNRHPELAPEFLDREAAEVYTTIRSNLERNRTVWDCVVANLGWWAAINVIGTIIISLIMLGSGVPWPWVLAACIAFTTFFTAFVILSCALNPEWHL
jgi:hypothetical protein